MLLKLYAIIVNKVSSQRPIAQVSKERKSGTSETKTGEDHHVFTYCTFISSLLFGFNNVHRIASARIGGDVIALWWLKKPSVMEKTASNEDVFQV